VAEARAQAAAEATAGLSMIDIPRGKYVGRRVARRSTQMMGAAHARVRSVLTSAFAASSHLLRISSSSSSVGPASYCLLRPMLPLLAKR
jgi:hypothetical protein